MNPERINQHQDDRGVEFAPGIYADHVMREPAWTWLSDYYGVPYQMMEPKAKDFGRAEALPVLTALLLQRNPDIAESEAWRLVRSLPERDLLRQLINLGAIGIDVCGRKLPRAPLQWKLKGDENERG